MAGELRNYDPELVTLTWTLVEPLGTIDLTQGLIAADGAIVESKDFPEWTTRGDRNGNYVRNKERRRGGFVTLTYVAEAEIQLQLSALAATDYATDTIIGGAALRDLNGATFVRYDGFFISATPAASYGATAANRPWVFSFAQRIPLLAGAAAL